MGRLVRTSIALAALGLARGLEAQGPVGPPPEWHVDLAVMAGYRFESTITFEFPGDYDRIEVDDAPTWGVALGYGPNPNWEFELQYSYTRAPATAIGTNPRVVNQSFDLGLHDFQLGVPRLPRLGAGEAASLRRAVARHDADQYGRGLRQHRPLLARRCSRAEVLLQRPPRAARRSPLHPGLPYSSGASGVWLCIEDCLLGHWLAFPAAVRPASGRDVPVLTGRRQSENSRPDPSGLRGAARRCPAEWPASASGDRRLATTRIASMASVTRRAVPPHGAEDDAIAAAAPGRGGFR